MEPLSIINMTQARPAGRPSERRAAAHALLKTTVIIWPQSGLFPSLRLSLLLQLWWNTACASIKHLRASACLIHSSPTDRPALISFTHESLRLISQLPTAHTPNLLLFLSLTYHIPHLEHTTYMNRGACKCTEIFTVTAHKPKNCCVPLKATFKFWYSQNFLLLSFVFLQFDKTSY